MLVLVTFSLFGQDITYYDTNYYKVNNITEASYYRIVYRFENDTNRAIEKEYYKSGKMKAWKQYSDYSKWILHGKQLQFYPDGK